VNALDPGRFEIFFYANVGRPDDMTERFRHRADHWRDLRFLSGSRLASLIRSDGLDVLVDLAGHTDGGMMALLASRLAPIQLTWLGYPATTGLSAMDYRLTDEVADPPGASESHCTERLIRLPGGFLCFSALDSPSPGPAVEKAVDADLPVVFGSFNNLFKVTPEVLSLWAEIVLAVPDSQLVLKYVQFDDPGVRSRVAAFLGECGLPAERLVLRGPVSPREHLETYGSIDIALDPFPYNGTTTTCEALYMGVPVVTLRGDSHVSRVGASILTTIGCQELIANDPAAYKRIAIELAGNPEHRRDLRKILPARFRASPLFDAPGFARKFEAALDRMLDGENTLKDRSTQ
jgi:predicted O-linked N-acetylglucosamine transferase (SPINDLY family)